VAGAMVNLMLAVVLMTIHYRLRPTGARRVCAQTEKNLRPR